MCVGASKRTCDNPKLPLCGQRVRTHCVFEELLRNFGQHADVEMP